MFPDEVIALILSHLPWEEDSDELLPLYPFAKQQWLMYTIFTNIITQETTIYKVNGIFHRSDGPAHIITKPNGYHHVRYYCAGMRHRLDGPAIIVNNPNGYYVSQYWYKNKLHRDNDPAVFIRKTNGKIIKEYWTHGEYTGFSD
jgi:hypothetical protein